MTSKFEGNSIGQVSNCVIVHRFQAHLSNEYPRICEYIQISLFYAGYMSRIPCCVNCIVGNRRLTQITRTVYAWSDLPVCWSFKQSFTFQLKRFQTWITKSRCRIMLFMGFLLISVTEFLLFLTIFISTFAGIYHGTKNIADHHMLTPSSSHLSDFWSPILKPTALQNKAIIVIANNSCLLKCYGWVFKQIYK